MTQIKLIHIPAMVAVLVIVGIAFGWRFEKTKEAKPPVIFAGSGNVYPWFTDHFSQFSSSLEPMWLDIGSGTALKQAFAAFDYGNDIQNKRMGFVVMSSNGTSQLAKAFRESSRAFREANPSASESDPFTTNNYWLALIVARIPLTVLYRDAGKKLSVREINDQSSQVDRPFGSSKEVYKTVSLESLRTLIGTPNLNKGLTLFLPEEETGTRALFDAAVKESLGETTEWPNPVHEVPTYTDRFGGTFPLVSLQSYPQLSHAKPSPDPCDRLRDNKLEVALVCNGAQHCSSPVESDYDLVFKISKENENEYLITNKAECQIARALDTSISSSCQVKDQPGADHIIIHTARGASLNEVPKYLTCTSSRSRR